MRLEMSKSVVAAVVRFNRWLLDKAYRKIYFGGRFSGSRTEMYTVIILSKRNRESQAPRQGDQKRRRKLPNPRTKFVAELNRCLDMDFPA